ncbi:MAG: YhcH/YjgK/YiaL family protein [Sedimentisphaerales bacterium]|nr:YhcH/YjgK/YiaL family protein [Sedimentisphaerales bacterium]
MIYDRMVFADAYNGHHPRLRQTIEFIRRCPADQASGRYEIQGNDIYAIVAEYETGSAETKRFEGHQRYIDVQVLLAGAERMDVAISDDLTVDEPYHKEKDVIFYKAPQEYTSLVLRPGYIVILYPQDIHRAGVCLTQPQRVRKLVVKVRL